MEKRILYTECPPHKSFLWLHHKDNKLVLESYNIHGWEQVNADTTVNIETLTNIAHTVNEVVSNSKIAPIKVSLPELTSECSKKELLHTIESLKNALVKYGIIEIE